MMELETFLFQNINKEQTSYFDINILNEYASQFSKMMPIYLNDGMLSSSIQYMPQFILDTMGRYPHVSEVNSTHYKFDGKKYEYENFVSNNPIKKHIESLKNNEVSIQIYHNLSKSQENVLIQQLKTFKFNLIDSPL